jgi:hypothetical protein
MRRTPQLLRSTFSHRRRRRHSSASPPAPRSKTSMTRSRFDMKARIHSVAQALNPRLRARPPSTLGVARWFASCRRKVAASIFMAATTIYVAPLLSCARTSYGDPCGNNGLIGTDNVSCEECSSGSPSTSCGPGCSSSVRGVCCCGGGGGGCTAQVCCGGLYECNGRCYSTCTPGSQPCCTSDHCTCYTPCC